MSKAGKKIISGLTEAVAYAKIDALWRRTKKKRDEEVTQYDWGYRDGLMAARSLFGKTFEPDDGLLHDRPPTTGKIIPGKARRIRKTG